MNNKDFAQEIREYYAPESDDWPPWYDSFINSTGEIIFRFLLQIAVEQIIKDVWKDEVQKE